FLEQGLEVAAGVRQQLESDAQRLSGLRLLPGRFMVIRQAMGLPKGRDARAAALLSAFVEDMKASGFVADALARHGIQGASVAPAKPGDLILILGKILGLLPFDLLCWHNDRAV